MKYVNRLTVTCSPCWQPIIVPITMLAIALVASSHQARLVADEETPTAPRPQVYTIPVSENAQYQFQARLIEAIPGDVIQFEEGRYEFHRQIDIAASHLTIRGRGSDKTVLSFKNQVAGGYGIEATGDAFLLEGIAVEDTAGNAIKVLGADGVTLRDVRTEWTGGGKGNQWRLWAVPRSMVAMY